MIRLTQIAHRELAAVLQTGDIAIDATAGNGNDTAFLAQCVGPSGIVYAFDIQALAITNTRSRLNTLNLNNVQLIEADHAKMTDYIAIEHRGNIAAFTFNLGYLPGGDRTVITKTASTLPALDNAISELKKSGIITIIVYPDHAGGHEEAESVIDFLSQRRSIRWQFLNDGQPELLGPRLLIARPAA